MPIYDVEFEYVETGRIFIKAESREAVRDHLQNLDLEKYLRYRTFDVLEIKLADSWNREPNIDISEES